MTPTKQKKNGVVEKKLIGLADVVRHRAAGVYRPYDDESVAALGELFARLEAEATDELLAEGVPQARVQLRRELDLRYRGLDAYLTIPQPDGRTYAESYEAEHRKLYGYVHAGRPLEIVAARVEAVGRTATTLLLPISGSTTFTPRNAPRPTSATTRTKTTSQ